MSITYSVKKIIDKYDYREPIFVKDFKIENCDIKEIDGNARDCALHNLEKEGLIRKYSKGIYYRPKKTMFGELGIDKERLVEYKYLRDKNGKLKGYITGPTIWYNLDMTTQVPNRKWIVTNKKRYPTVDDELGIKILKPKMKVNEKLIKYYQLLDIIDQHDMIQDLNKERYDEYILETINKFRENDIKKMKKIVRNYNNSVSNMFESYLHRYLKDCMQKLSYESEKEKVNMYSQIYTKKIEKEELIDLYRDLTENDINKKLNENIIELGTDKHYKENIYDLKENKDSERKWYSCKATHTNFKSKWGNINEYTPR